MRVRRICGKMASKLASRNYGVRDGDCINLSGEEYLYLVERGIVNGDFASVFREESSNVDFDIRYLVYRDLKNRGYSVSVFDDHFHARKSFSMDFYPISDMDVFRVGDALRYEKPFILGVVDSDGDITYYLVDLADPEGKARDMPRGLKIEVIGRRAMIFENAESLSGVSFGRYEGKYGHLSLFEAQYLIEKKVAEGKIKILNEIYDVYRDLRDRGLIVKSGFKYGTHFRAYETTMEEHSRYLVHVIPEEEEIQKLSRAIRVAHGVRKQMLFAHKFSGKIYYFLIRWIRP